MSRGGIDFTGLCFTTVSVTPGAISANTSAEVTVTLNGALATDVVLNFIKPTLTAGIDIGNFRMSANNTMKATYQNSTAAPITPPTETYTLVISRPEKVLGGSDALSGGNVVFN